MGVAPAKSAGHSPGTERSHCKPGEGVSANCPLRGPSLTGPISTVRPQIGRSFGVAREDAGARVHSRSQTAQDGIECGRAGFACPSHGSSRVESTSGFGRSAWCRDEMRTSPMPLPWSSLVPTAIRTDGSGRAKPSKPPVVRGGEGYSADARFAPGISVREVIGR